MTYTEQELRIMWMRSNSMPKGPARFAALEEVIRHADAMGLEEFAFDVRMSATDAFHHGGEPVKAFLSFSWCLAAYDRDPARFNPYVEGRLRWQFKWMVWALPQFPDIPLERTFAVLDDMQRRYLRAGQSLHAVYQHRWLVAHHLGDMDAAQLWYDQMITARRDGNSDCASCVPSSQVRHLASLGRYEEAVRIGEPVRSGGCTEQPQWINSELLIPYLRTGRHGEAVDAHRAAYRRMRDDRHHLDNIAQHVLFCALTQNEDKALDLIERHLPWLERPSSPFAAMEFSASAANALARLIENGRGGATVRRIAAPGTDASDEATVAELLEEMRARALRAAARFDARNGNDHQTRRVETRMNLEPIATRVPLTVISAVPAPGTARDTVGKLVEQVARLTEYGDLAGAATTRVQVAVALMRAKRWVDAAECAEEAVRELERSDQKTEAASCRYLLVNLYRRLRDTKAAVATIDELLDADVEAPDIPTPAELHMEAARMLGFTRAASDHHLAAARLYATTGQHLDQIHVLNTAIRSLTHQDPIAARAALADADKALTTHAVDDDSWRAARVHLDVTAALLLGRTGDADTGILRLQTAMRVLDGGGDGDGEGEAANDGTRFEILVTLASLHLRRASNTEAEDAARQALTMANDDDGQWQAATVLARALKLQGRDQEATQVAGQYDLDDDYDDEDL